MAKIEFGAPIPHDILLGATLTVNATAVVYTNAFVLAKKQFFGIEVQFSSDTDVSVKVDFEQSNYSPEVQGSASPNFVVAIDSIGTITDENVHLYPVAPIVSVYGRLKLTGQAANSITTQLTRANWVEVEE